jgi:predicted lysophospholipase L1 biosynthesis ABC-type transport system permease subunit
MKIARYLLCIVLGLSGLGHLAGTFLFYAPGTDVFVWSLSAAAFVASVIVFNLFALSGETRHLVAAAVASVAWAGLALGFGHAIGAIADPRVLAHALTALALAGLDLVALADGGRNPVRARA